jgi:hypothetical protein
MEQNGGSDAQHFHDRGRSRDAATGAGTIRLGGCASSTGEPSQADLELVLKSIPVAGKPAGIGLARYICQRAAGTAACPAAGRVLIERRGSLA